LARLLKRVLDLGPETEDIVLDRIERAVEGRSRSGVPVCRIWGLLHGSYLLSRSGR
jgi:hypothetical protein